MSPCASPHLYGYPTGIHTTHKRGFLAQRKSALRSRRRWPRKITATWASLHLLAAAVHMALAEGRHNELNPISDLFWRLPAAERHWYDPWQLGYVQAAEVLHRLSVETLTSE